MGETTETVVYVSITVVAECPNCRKIISNEMKLTEESISTGNTTQTARYAVDAMKKRVDDAKKRRGWTPNLCGACQDE